MMFLFYSQSCISREYLQIKPCHPKSKSLLEGEFGCGGSGAGRSPGTLRAGVLQVCLRTLPVEEEPHLSSPAHLRLSQRSAPASQTAARAMAPGVCGQGAAQSSQLSSLWLEVWKTPQTRAAKLRPGQEVDSEEGKQRHQRKQWKGGAPGSNKADIQHHPGDWDPVSARRLHVQWGWPAGQTWPGLS